jgi:HrpA-like RNA helicase
MQILETSMINRSSADQRKGRAGRTSPGVCYRLYSEEDYEGMPASETPEILRSHLGMCILELKLLGFDAETFDFVEKPSAVALAKASETLRYLGCLDDNRALTPKGKKVARMEMQPEMCCMILKVSVRYLFCAYASLGRRYALGHVFPCCTCLSCFMGACARAQVTR